MIGVTNLQVYKPVHNITTNKFVQFKPGYYEEQPVLSKISKLIEIVQNTRYKLK